MSTTQVKTPTSLLRLGYARCDTTPPVGIYHRMWGAARHDAADGIHRPLQADVLILEPIGGDSSERILRLQTDFVGLTNEQTDRLVANLAEASGTPADRILVTHSHSHASGVYAPNRKSLPGGDLIEPYLDELNKKVIAAADEALASLDEATITYAVGRCNMAANRDYPDEQNGIYATGYNPDREADDTVLVGRVTDAAGNARLIIVNYACHPTTLAWDNTLISPDYVGALRETVEQNANVACCFYQAPCGELGPKDGFVGDVEVADRNGKQVAHAALSALFSMGPARTDFAYAGPVVSGATIGTWEWREQSADRVSETSVFRGGNQKVGLEMIDLPSLQSLQSDLARFTEAQAEADERGDVVAARDTGARAERCRRWIGRLEQLPVGQAFAFGFTVYQFGDAVWVICGAEPYNWMQTELRRRFPTLTLMISSIAGDSQVAYLLTRDSYGKGLYQEEPSALAPGCLEALTDAITDHIESVTGHTRA
jgi:hypothetical protein